MYSINQQKNDITLLPFSFKNWLKSNKFILFILFFLVFISYVNALGNDFVSDDRGLLINVPSYTIGNIIGKSYFLRALQYFLIYHIGGGLNPFLLRLPNIFFHAGSVWLIFLLVSILKNRIIGVFSAALFAVHPILVESVTWIAGGVYVEYSFFLLLSFVLYIQSVKSKKMYAFSLFVFLLSLLFSEKAVVLFLLLFLYEICLGNIKRNWKRIGAYLIVSSAYIFLLIGRLGERTINLQTDQATAQTFYNPLIQIPVAITSYLQLIFWPDELTLYHSEMTFSQIEYAVRFLAFFFFVAGMGISYKKNKHIFFWLSFFIIALLPTLTPLGVSWVVAERYVYLGSLGIFVVAGVIMQKLTENKQRRMAVYAVFSLIVIALTIRTIVRNIDWKNEDNLWLSSARTSPSSSQNHNNLGDYYGRHGNVEMAAKEFQRAIELKPNYADAYHNLGNAYRDMRKTNEAIEQYKKALSFKPGLWQSYQNIAVIYYQQGKFDLAKENVQKAMSIEPNNTQLMAFMGLIYLKTSNINKAKEIFLSVLQKDPQNQLAKEGLSQISP